MTHIGHTMIDGIPLVEWPCHLRELAAPDLVLRHRTGRSRRQHLVDEVRVCDWGEVEQLHTMWRATPSELADAVTATDKRWSWVRNGLLNEVQHPARLDYEPKWSVRRIETRIVRWLNRTEAILRHRGAVS